MEEKLTYQKRKLTMQSDRRMQQPSGRQAGEISQSAANTALQAIAAVNPYLEEAKGKN